MHHYHATSASTQTLQKRISTFESRDSMADFRNSNTFRLEGYLYKLGYIRKSWKKRWFSISLLDTRLFYYKTNTTTVAQGFIDLEDVKEITVCEAPPPEVCFLLSFEKGEYAFSLETAHRTYYLTAETEQERNYWLKGLANFKRHVASALNQISSTMLSPSANQSRNSLASSSTTALGISSTDSATANVLQGIEQLGARIESCLELISKRGSMYTSDYNRFAKAKDSLKSNAVVWVRLDPEEAGQTVSEVKQQALSDLEEASRLMSSIYGLVDDIDLMQAQIERETIQSFTRPPDSVEGIDIGGFSVDLSVERRKQLLETSIANSWKEVQDKLDKLDLLVTRMELLRSEIPPVSSSLPTPSFIMGIPSLKSFADGFTIPSARSSMLFAENRLSSSCPSGYDLLLGGDSQVRSPSTKTTTSNSSPSPVLSGAPTSGTVFGMDSEQQTLIGSARASQNDLIHQVCVVGGSGTSSTSSTASTASTSPSSSNLSSSFEADKRKSRRVTDRLQEEASTPPSRSPPTATVDAHASAPNDVQHHDSNIHSPNLPSEAS